MSDSLTPTNEQMNKIRERLGCSRIEARQAAWKENILRAIAEAKTVDDLKGPLTIVVKGVLIKA